jgi:hypothetical protein
VATYLMEWYLSVASPRRRASLTSRLRAAAAGMRANGIHARLLGFIVLPEEETAFCLLEAPDRDVVEQLGAMAGISADRIVEAIPDSGRCPDCSDPSG